MILPLTVRASSTGRTFGCHGSILAVPLVGKDEDEGGGNDGSLIHYLIAARCVQELGARAPEGGLVYPKLPTGYKLPAFSAWIVDWGFRWVQENIPADWALLVELPLAHRYELARPVWVPVIEITGPIPSDHEVKDGMVCIRYVILSGHLDVFGISPDGTQSKGVDWKTGPVGADPAEENWQAATYLGLGKMEWDTLRQSDFTLAQPMIDEEATGIDRLSTVEMSGDKLDRMNAVLVEEVNKALENRYETDSSPKNCRWCPVAKLKPYACPSLVAEETFMKANLTKESLAQLRDKPNDALLADFVISGRTLAGPVKAATEMIHERIELLGYVDAGCGHRLTVKTKGGAYKIPDPAAFMAQIRTDLGTDERIAACVKPSMDRLKDQIAVAKGIKRISKHGESAESVFEANYRPLVEQGVAKELVVT